MSVLRLLVVRLHGEQRKVCASHAPRSDSRAENPAEGVKRTVFRKLLPLKPYFQDWKHRF